MSSYIYVATGYTASNVGTSASTPAVNMTGSGLLVLCSTSLSSCASAVVTDNFGNTWNFIEETTTGSAIPLYAGLWYSVPTSIGNNYQLTFNPGVVAKFQIGVMGFNGTPPASPLVTSAKNTGALNTVIQTPVYTPPSSDYLLVAAVGSYGTSGTITAPGLSPSLPSNPGTWTYGGTGHGGTVGSYPSHYPAYWAQTTAQQSQLTITPSSNQSAGYAFAAFAPAAGSLFLSLSDTFTLVESVTEAKNAWFFISNTVNAGTGLATVTSPSFNSTGAAMLVACFASSNNQPGVLTDSQGNNWIKAIQNPVTQSGTTVETVTWYTTGPSGNPFVLSTSASHTVTCSASLGVINLEVLVFGNLANRVTSPVVIGTSLNTGAAVGSLAFTGTSAPSRSNALIVTTCTTTGFANDTAISNTNPPNFLVSSNNGTSQYPPINVAYEIQINPVSVQFTYTFTTHPQLAAITYVVFAPPSESTSLVLTDTISLVDNLSSSKNFWVFTGSSSIKGTASTIISATYFDSTQSAMIVLVFDALTSTPITVTDSQNNAWTLAKASGAGNAGNSSSIYYTTGPSGNPRVLNTSTTHTITIASVGGGNLYANAEILLFWGRIPPSGLIEATSSFAPPSTVSNQTLNPGTPTTNNALIVSNASYNGNGTMIAAGSPPFILVSTNNGVGGQYPSNTSLYSIQTTATGTAVGYAWSTSVQPTGAAVIFALAGNNNALALTDTFTVTDSVQTNHIVAHNPYVDTLLITDYLAVNKSFHKSYSDSFTISDPAIHTLHAHFKTLADVLTITDVLLPKTYGRLLVDQLSIFEQFIPPNHLHGLNLVETFVIHEVISDTVQRAKILVDAINLASTETITKTSNHTLIDQLSVFEYYGSYVAYHLFLSNFIFLTDTFSVNGLSRAVKLNDALTLSEILGKTSTHTLLDSLSFGENFYPYVRRGVNSLDTFPVLEAFFKMGRKISSDLISLVEVVTDTFGRMKFDMFSLMDSLIPTFNPAVPFIPGFIHIFIDFWDNVGFDDLRIDFFVNRVKTLALFDGTGIAEVRFNLGRYWKASLIDAISISEAFSTKGQALADIVGLSDHLGIFVSNHNFSDITGISDTLSVVGPFKLLNLFDGLTIQDTLVYHSSHSRSFLIDTFRLSTQASPPSLNPNTRVLTLSDNFFFPSGTLAFIFTPRVDLRYPVQVSWIRGTKTILPAGMPWGFLAQSLAPGALPVPTTFFDAEETPSGVIGTTGPFVLTYVPTKGSLQLFKNGTLLALNLDYTLTNNVITLVIPTVAGDVLFAVYTGVVE